MHPGALLKHALKRAPSNCAQNFYLADALACGRYNTYERERCCGMRERCLPAIFHVKNQIHVIAATSYFFVQELIFLLWYELRFAV
jgi:hypothetical protein